MLSFLVNERGFLGADRSRLLAQGNVPPVAVNDPRTVLRGSGPVTVAVLVNDVDPEGQPLTLVSAFAALGTAVAETDGTVTYTPPQGEAAATVDFDTVVYEIEDIEGARDTGQIDITISDPNISIATLPNNTFEVSAGPGPIEITITDPAAFAGTYTADLIDLAYGPVNLALPQITGNVSVGTILEAVAGLWIHDTGAGTPSRGWQWQRRGNDIPGATGASYQVQPGDEGLGLRAVETLTDGFGARGAASAVLGASTPDADLKAIAWWDAADAATISDGGTGSVQNWTDKLAAFALGQANAAREPATGTRQLNGLNVIDFNGGDFLEAPLTLPGSGDVAFHMVLIIDSTANAFGAVLSAEAINDFQIDADNASAFDGRLNLAGVGAPVALSGGPFSGPMILSTVFDRTGAGTADVFVADILRATTAYSQPLDTAVVLHVMTNRSKNAWVNGAVAELIVTGDVTNRASHHAYLAAKWGIA